MTRGQAREKRQKAGEGFLVIWGIAVIPNALDAFGVDVDGTGWDILRLALGALWLVALAVLIVAFVRERRTPRELSAE